MYFDDLEITLKESNVIQSNDYYPFGLALNTSWTRSTALKNKYLFNAGSELNDQTGNYETAFRQYDPALGRFNSVDAMAGMYPSMSPYRFGFNNPISYNDPAGLLEDTDWWFGELGDDSNSSSGNGVGSMLIGIGSGNHWSDQYGSGGNYFNASWYDVVGDALSGNLTGLREGTYLNDGSGGVTFYSPTDRNAPWIYNKWVKDYVPTAAILSFDPTHQNQKYRNRAANQHQRFLDDIRQSWSDIRASQNNGATDFSNANTALTVGAAIYGAMEGATVSQGYWLGKNGKYYLLKWGGNQYTGSRASALSDAKLFRNAGKVTMFVSAGIGVYSTIEGYQMDGGEFGYNAQMAAASSTGSIVGGWAGAEAGAAIGAGIGVWFGGVGAVPGAVIGGFIGGIAGSFGGSYVGESTVNYYHGR